MIQATFITPAEVDAIRKLIASDAQARAVVQQSIALPARQALRRPLRVPPPFANRHSTFSHPEHGGHLIFNPDSPHEHRDAQGRVFRGEAFDRGWATIQHNHNANDARDCALAAVLLDDAMAAQRAREILLAYGDAYHHYPPMGRQTATWGRVHNSALEEAVWIIPLLWTAQLLGQQESRGWLTADDAAMLTRNLFEPVVDLLWGEWYFIHNVRMWCNAAIGSIGLALNDRHAIRRAIHGQRGYRQQLVDGFRLDGLLYEGSVGYHSYGLTAMLILSEAMKRSGYEPYVDDYLKTVILAPFRLMQPDGSPPSLNDYWPSRSLPTRNMGTGLCRYGDDPQISAAAAHAFNQWREQGYRFDQTCAPWNNTPAYFGRQQVDWLLAWPRLDAAQHFTPPRQMVMPQSGLAVIRPGPGDFLLLKCSALGSGHDHHDKLGVIWWDSGRCWLNDMGTTTYGIPLHESWIKHTLSHNTVLIDGRQHERCTAHLLEGNDQLLCGQANPYPTQMPDVHFQRQVQLNAQGELGDEFTVTGHKSRQMDYVLRPIGVLDCGPDVHFEPAPLPGHDPAYQVLRQSRRVHFKGPPQLTWRQGEARLTIDLSDLPQETQVWIAEAPCDVQDLQRLGSMLILRLTAVKANFRVNLRASDAASPRTDESSLAVLRTS